MYRTELLAACIDKLIQDDEIYPICVPSYNRPNPKILEALDREPDLPIVLFIRRGQESLYKKYRSKCKIVRIPEETENIGQTRKAILDWAISCKISNIFMLDDDIDELDYLYPHPTSNGNMCMRASRQNLGRDYKGINKRVFKMWMHSIKQSDRRLAISTLAYRPDSWHLKNADADVVYNSGSCIQCCHINVKLLYKNGINYRDTEECGNEDYALQYDAMSAGLLTAVFKDFMYGCPAVGSVAGGCENASGIADVKERYTKYVDLFFENVCGKDHPGVLTKNTNRSKIPSVKFN